MTAYLETGIQFLNVHELSVNISLNNDLSNFMRFSNFSKVSVYTERDEVLFYG